MDFEENREQTQRLHKGISAPTQKVAWPSEIWTWHPGLGKANFISQKPGCVQNPDAAFYIHTLLGYFNIMTSYTFETKSNKVPVPQQP